MSEVLAQLEKKGGGGNWTETVLYKGNKTQSNINIAPYNFSDFDAFKIRSKVNVDVDSWWDVWVDGVTTQIGHVSGNYSSSFSISNGGSVINFTQGRSSSGNWVLGITDVIGIKF